ncbi:MAG: CPXCG motif-containing cysteine-rich protein [Gammaproteobacteria bacterium]|nr:CPXCG motif-containing cysteine-rich protein [Gammaproteobacteria bacterium]
MPSQLQHEKTIQCPYCWECISILIDPSVPHQEYVEDCQVCCRPILLEIQCNDGAVDIQVQRENE